MLCFITLVSNFTLGDQITSGSVSSKQLYTPDNVPGNKLKVEFTSTVPAVMGTWPALWMVGVEVGFKLYYKQVLVQHVPMI